MNDNKKTFWKIISSYSIQVPTIQRDYTYGRNSAKNIRVKLIKDIKKAIDSNESENLHLDFVYGKLKGKDNFKSLERNKQSINTLLSSLQGYANNLHLNIEYKTTEKTANSSDIISLIPLDGQQRLTTLFLIHWYLAKKNNNDTALKELSKFTYVTRNSSIDFLKMLNQIELLKFNNDGNNLSIQISNHELFFTFWKKDPTVNSMLVVLDEIQTQFQDVNETFAWENLVENNKVTFDFFDLDDFEQTDELYVKMNARGKKLTHFENFKAWLIKNHSNNITIEDWKKKLDIQWNDVFWNKKPNGNSSIDTPYLQFFKNMFLGDYILSAINSKTNDFDVSLVDDNYIDVLREKPDENPLEIFASSKIFGANINNYLEVLKSFEDETIEVEFYKQYNKTSLTEFVFYKNQNYTWWNATLYFALTRYLIINKGETQYFKQWVRIISNLIFNSPIESPKQFTLACKSIVEVLEGLNGNSVIELFASKKPDEINFFLSKQKEEEILKAKIIKEDSLNNWEEEFIKLEKHTYFYGQIGFLIDLFRKEGFELFKIKAGKIAKLFNEENLKENKYLLNRLFLSYKECFVQRGINYMFYSNDYGTLRTRNENWRLIFSNHQDLIEKVLEIKSYDAQTIEGVIEKNSKKNVLPEYIIPLLQKPKLFDYMKKRCLRKVDGNAIYLLNSSRIYGYCVELYTYDFYLSNETNYGYDFVKNNERVPHFYSKNAEEKYFSINKQEEFINESNKVIKKENLQHA